PPGDRGPFFAPPYRPSRAPALAPGHRGSRDTTLAHWPPISRPFPSISRHVGPPRRRGGPTCSLQKAGMFGFRTDFAATSGAIFRLSSFLFVSQYLIPNNWSIYKQITLDIHLEPPGSPP